MGEHQGSTKWGNGLQLASGRLGLCWEYSSVSLGIFQWDSWTWRSPGFAARRKGWEGRGSHPQTPISSQADYAYSRKTWDFGVFLWKECGKKKSLILADLWIVRLQSICSKFALARGGDEAWAASGCWEKSQDFLHPSEMILGKYLSHSAAMGYKTAQGWLKAIRSPPLPVFVVLSLPGCNAK